MMYASAVMRAAGKVACPLHLDDRTLIGPTGHRHSIRTSRRGVTLVEMLVTLAMLLLMMTAIVQIFQAATGALNAAQVYQELDNQLRLLDSTIRSDLDGVTCKLTPPNDPKNNPGYFEYGENEFADVQGEDSDDYIRFTAKAPAGRPFTGRMWIAPITSPANSAQRQPSPADHDHQRIRRDHLLPAQRQPLPPRLAGGAGAAVGDRPSVDNVEPQPAAPPASSRRWRLGGATQVSWQGVNDLSAHPAPPATVARATRSSSTPWAT